jgi:transposase-like protein
MEKWRKQGRELTRFKVRERDNFTCQDCGKKWKEGERHFDVHHLNGMCGKKSRGYDKLEDMDGLVTLCHKCHFNRHDWAGVKKSKIIPLNELKKTQQLRDSGLTLREVGEIIGISREGVRWRLIKYKERQREAVDNPKKRKHNKVN